MTRLEEPPSAVAPRARAAAFAPPRAATLDLQVQPAVATARRSARYVATVTNPSSAPVQARLSVVSPTGEVRGLVAPAVVDLPPGGPRSVAVELRPRRPLLARRERDRAAAVQARGDAGAPVARRGIVLVQTRALPLWSVALALAAAAAAACALVLLAQRTTVPRVEGAADVAAAQRALRAAGLQVDPRVRSRIVDDVRPGTVLDQIPDPGARAVRGDRVALLVALSTRRAVMPDVESLPVGRAVAVVRAAGLSAGSVPPAGAPASALVGGPLPPAGRRVAAGTVVTLFAARGATRGAPAPLDGGEVSVPAVEGRPAAEYARAVAAAGLTPTVVRAVDPAPLGSLVAVRPRPGSALAPGSSVRLVVAAGVPWLAFDTGSVMRLFDPRGGRTVREAAPPVGSAGEPSWSADGRRVLYRVGRRLLLVSASSASRGRVVYAGRTRFAAATIAPTLTAGVVALVRRSGRDGDLCLARLGGGDLRPRCLRDPRWDLGRTISWRPDGRELLVFGVRRGRPGTFGILRYRSTRAFSADPRHWRGAIATDTGRRGRGVIAAAYGPAREVALVTNVGLDRFQLVVAPAARLRDRRARALPVRACEVAWRPDGAEVAVVQSDDACSRPNGELVRVDLARPRRTVTVAGAGRHPSYQPLAQAGPKGLG
ncbi:MAG TPA: PASTA domain-containing protein [Solirubrobacteraceae bacterium]|nr:PASTA domain-containing protein [Solirubrobacteraceae bacterium]